MLPSQTGHFDSALTSRAWEFATTLAPTLPAPLFKRQNISGDGDEGEICGLGLTDPGVSFQCGLGYSCFTDPSFSLVECCSTGDIPAFPQTTSLACVGTWTTCVPLASSASCEFDPTCSVNILAMSCYNSGSPFCQTLEWEDLNLTALQCAQNNATMTITMIADPFSSSATPSISHSSVSQSILGISTEGEHSPSLISTALATFTSLVSFSSKSPTTVAVPSDQTSSPSSSSGASTSSQTSSLFSPTPASIKTSSSSVASSLAQPPGVHNHTTVIISAVVSGTLGSVVILTVVLLCIRYWRCKRAAATPAPLIISPPNLFGSPTQFRRHSKIEHVAGVPPEMLMRNPAIGALNLSSQEYQQLSPRELSYVNSIAVGPDGQPYGREYCELPA